MIVVRCSCGAKFRAPDTLAGHRVKCRSCLRPVIIPAVAAALPATPPPQETPAAPAQPAVDMTEVDILPSRTLGRMSLRCRACGGRLSVRAASSGKRAGCPPTCKRKFVVPKMHEGAPVAAPDESLEELEVLDVVTSDSGLVDASPSGTLDLDQSDNGLLSLSEDDGPPMESQVLAERRATAVPKDGPVCPSCSRQLARNAKYCVECGIDARTGRSILTADDTLDNAYIAAEVIITRISWILWYGFCPIASEAFGTRKPLAMKIILWLTIATSVAFWIPEWSAAPRMQSLKFLLLWKNGSQPLSAEVIDEGYWAFAGYGDSEAFQSRVLELSQARRAAAAASRAASAPAPAAAESAEAEGGASAGEEPIADGSAESESSPADGTTESADAETLEEEEEIDPAVRVEAYESLTPQQRCFGEYRTYQLLTHAFLHGNILHLLGNLVFFWVFGSRVNALIGSPLAAILYVLLAVNASLIDYAMEQTPYPKPALGASGAIAGLAGLYLVLFPMHRVHMAWWWRPIIIGSFELHLKLFSLRGFWVVIWFFGWDVFYTIWQLPGDNIAHWAHLGGLFSGMTLGLLLLVTRLVNARGGDLLSTLLGRRAWALVGRPNQPRGREF